MTEEAQNLVANALTQMGLSARSYHRTVKLARTIADLEGMSQIDSKHLAEALQYRSAEDLFEQTTAKEQNAVSVRVDRR